MKKFHLKTATKECNHFSGFHMLFPFGELVAVLRSECCPDDNSEWYNFVLACVA